LAELCARVRDECSRIFGVLNVIKKKKKREKKEKKRGRIEKGKTKIKIKK